MVARGLQINNTRQISFKWDVKIGDTDFSLQLEEFDPTFIKLPIVTLLTHPAGLPKTLTHVNPDKTLCYLDKSQVYLDPYKPAETLDLILNSIYETLNKLIDKKSVLADFAREFDSYWEAHDNCYLLTHEKPLKALFFERVREIGEVKAQEWVIFNEKDEVRCEKWLKKRNIQEKVREVPVVKLNFNSPPQLPSCIELDTWPPKNWKEFYTWLTDYHPQLANELMRRLCESTDKSLQQLVLFSVPNLEGGHASWFATRIKFSKRIQDLARRYIASKRPGRKKKVVTPDTVRTMFKRDITSNYYRLSVQDSSTGLILNRNAQQSILEGKRVAVIGCGTIGANLSNLLIKVGAGTGSCGSISIYDKDILKPANIGRHLLGEEYLGEAKSFALKDFLQLNTWQININANHSNINSDSQLLGMFRSFDLIIDATGEQQFSSFLNHHYRKALKDKKKVICSILYGWVDANGLAVRAILDDAKFACYRCLLFQKNGILHERLPLKAKGAKWPDYAKKRIACGESYTPYTEGVSYTAAGILQAMAIDYFAGNPTPRFRHLSLHKSIPSAKAQNLPALNGCPCCG
jgi:molybdopterin/thiamine biosynthesis adenylyltransferase